MPAAAEVARKLYDELEQSDVLAVLKEKRAAKKATEDKGKAKAANVRRRGRTKETASSKERIGNIAFISHSLGFISVTVCG